MGKEANAYAHSFLIDVYVYVCILSCQPQLFINGSVLLSGKFFHTEYKT